MIDTVEISHKLQATGIPKEQAEAIAQSLLEVPKVGGLATQEDIAKLHGEINVLKLMIAGVYALLVPILLKLFLH